MGQTSDFWELVDSNADVAPAGRGRVRLKGGVIQQSVNGGAWSTIGGGGSLPAGPGLVQVDGAGVGSIATGVQAYDTQALIAGTVAPFMAARDAALTKIALWATGADLFSKLDPGTAVLTGNVTQVIGGAGNDMRIRLETGATANSSRPLRVRTQALNAAASAFSVQTANARINKWGIWARFIVNAVNATCNLAVANMTDEATADVTCGVIGASSQVNFFTKIGAAAAQDTGVAIGTLGVTVHDAYWICDATNIKSYFDGSAIAATTGLANTAVNGPCHWQLNPSNGATASNASIDLLGMAVFVA